MKLTINVRICIKNLRASVGNWLRPKIKKYLFKVYVPSIFKRYSKKPIIENLAVFADATSETLPDNMTEIYERLKAEGWEVRVFLKRKSSKKMLKNRLYEKRNAARFTKSYARCKCLFLTDYYYYAYANQPREGQQVIQLWHGCGAFKKWGYSTLDLEWGGSRKDFEEYPVHNTYTYVTVSSDEVKKHYAEAFNCSEEIIHACGVPRTDKYFDKKFVASARKTVTDMYPEIGNRKILLYSPTFRGTSRGKAGITQMLDYLYLKKKLEKDYVILVKLHPFIKKGMNLNNTLEELYNGFVFDVSKTLSIETAMCAADMVITDYSSLIFEYALLKRPMIFFAYDIEQYDRERSFYYDYRSFVPGDIVMDSEELVDSVRKNEKEFDEKRVEEFRDKFMSACDGNSTQRLIENAVLNNTKN